VSERVEGIRMSCSQAVEFLKGRCFLSGGTLRAASNVRPVVSAVSASPNPAAKGVAVGLTASGVTDSDGSITEVQFYRDINANGVFDRSIDPAISVDRSARHGWSAAVDTSALATGTIRFFARAYDNLYAVSRPVAVDLTVQGKINLAGNYSGSIIFNDKKYGQDVLQGHIDSQSRGYFSGVFHQVAADIDLVFDGTIGRNNTFSLVYAGDVTGTAKGTISADSTTLTGTFATTDRSGKSYGGRFSVHRV
jgi:hypothetical protein